VIPSAIEPPTPLGRLRRATGNEGSDIMWHRVTAPWKCKARNRDRRDTLRYPALLSFCEKPTYPNHHLLLESLRGVQ